MNLNPFAFFIFFICGFCSRSVPAFELTVYPVLTESRYQKNQDQQMMLRPYSVFSVGLDVRGFSFLLERAFYEEVYGGSSLVTKHEQTNYTFQGRLVVFEREDAGELIFQILPSVGMGLHQDRSTTKLFSSESTDTSAWEPLATAGVVVRARFHFFVLETEGRIFSGKLLDPTFSTGGVLRIGAIF